VLRAPPIVAHGPNWMLAATVEQEELPIEWKVERVVAAALEIPELRLPPSPWPEHAGAVVVARRRLRLLRSPLPTRDVVAARRILADVSLPRVTSHGSYQRHHVFLADGAAWVIDWEQSGERPLGVDLLHYSANLDEAHERELVFETAVDAIGRRYERELRRLRYAVFVRLIASKLVDDAQPESARRLLQALPEIREAAR
jgi:hypothetical protein